MVRDGDYTHPEYLADTAWLAERLNDESIRIVDTDVPDAYNRAHIPGAVVVWDNLEKDPAAKRVHIMPPQDFARQIEALGIGDYTHVITTPRH